MHPTKAQGPDGYRAKIFQSQWGLIGKSISNMILGYLNQGISISYVHETFITLIPKVKNLETMTDFRSITL